MLFCGLQKTTLLDYPEHVAATVFLGGCNFRCPYCQNSDLLLDPASYAAYTKQDILSYLQKRKNILTGVCITGGEPTIYHDLPDFLAEVKQLGYLVKLDSNGSNPFMLQTLYEQKLIDYVAMDIKSGPSDYLKVAGLTDPADHSTSYAFSDEMLARIRESVHFLMHETDERRFTYEFRTTVVRELHSAETFREIGDWIKGAKRYFLQSYKESEQVLCPGFSAYSRMELEKFIEILKPNIPSVALRGVD